jgi:glycoside/pentoside/hexuronide:cation symporter, GPH family
MSNKNNDPIKNDLTFGQTLAYAAGTLPAEFAPILITSWLFVFYIGSDTTSKTGLYMGLFAFVIVQFIGRVMDSVADPLVGFFSDRTESRWGRRIPYIIFGTPGIAITCILVWFPITDYPSMANNLWLLGNLLVFWFCFTVVVAPFLSLLPEIASSEKERLSVGGWQAVFAVIGMILASLVAGLAIVHFKDGIDLGFIRISDGYKIVGIFAAIIILVFHWLTWWFIKEKPASQIKKVDLNFYQATKETLKNPTYPHYVITISILRLLIDIVLGLLPFFVSAFLFLNEGQGGKVQAAIIVGSIFFFPIIVWTSKKYGKKKVFAIGLLSFATFLPLAVLIPVIPIYDATLRLILTIFVFALLAPGAAAFLVLQRVMITDIMDYDEKITGFRREAMYNGIEGLIVKLAAGMAPVVIAFCILLFNTENFAKGILVCFGICAFLALVAFSVFRFYPIRK